MLSGYWLLSDLDGTLISTPHKAHGQYLPITRSPCFSPIRRWLLNGGNVCIVTTADQRVVEQVFLPLRSTLAIASKPCVSVQGALPHSHHGEGFGRPGSTCGRLLLSLYTGSVLYSCTATSVELVPKYATTVHVATRESGELSKHYQVPMPLGRVLNEDGTSTQMKACVRGTCINRCTSEKLQASVQSLYEDYIHDILTGEPGVLASMKGLSRRYKNMWRSVLTFLEDLYVCTVQEAASTPSTFAEDDYSILFSGTTAVPAAVAWKMRYVKAGTNLLAALGILRVEYVQEKVDYGDSADNANARRTQEAVDKALAEDHAVETLLASLPSDTSKRAQPLVKQFAAYICNLLGTDPCDLKKRMASAARARDAGDCDSNSADVAQVILLGLPLTLFSKYFRESMTELVRAGVCALPQPNSVVFSKMGVSKSTTLRFLLGKERVMEGCELSKATWRGTVKPQCAVALGDNPHSTDFELTVFDDVTFVSVEKESQRCERHTRINRRLARTKALEDSGEMPTMPDGRPAPSYAALHSTLRKSGPMMDDRQCGNIAYIGGEEDGTAALLTLLMDFLGVPVLEESVRATTHPEGQQCVPSAEFHKALAQAERSVQRRSVVSKL